MIKNKPKPPKSRAEPVYHLLDLRNEACGYRGGYANKDTLMLYACLNLLQQYVEEERPFEVIDWSSSPGCQDAAKEIKVLYQWWTQDRKRLAAALEAQWEALDWKQVLSGKRSKEHTASPRYIKDVDDEMLQRLIKIRRYLWT